MATTKFLLIFFLFALIGLPACSPAPTGNEAISLDAARAEIREAERAFAEMAASDGVAAAFLAFAADSAVLNRNDVLIRGKAAMQAYFEKSTLKDVSLQWTPEFVDVSASGDLGYTYGPYTFSAVDTSGQTIRSEGLFHTVWKRQADGTWKFVYD